MSDSFADLLGAIRAWMDEGAAAGWIAPHQSTKFDQLELATAADLFVDGAPRPLVVALFGGTGVGKSSLLNRLARQPVAKVGVQRPTSREVTLYLHRDVQLKDFPETLPVERVSVVRHEVPSRRDIAWLDMPDIDSVARDNRDTALAWLPHVDLLIYVLSPERYRDDVGWQVLHERGQRHAWIFVMNRWDEGAAELRDDCFKLLKHAGFEDPLLLTTASASEAPAAETRDQLGQLEAALQEILQAHGVEEIERLGHRARLQQLRQRLASVVKAIGDDAAWTKLSTTLAGTWQQVRQRLAERLVFQFRLQLAQQVASDPSLLHQTIDALRRLGTSDDDASATPPAPVPELERLTERLWDDQASAQCDRVTREVRLVGDQLAVATGHVERAIAGEFTELGATLSNEVREDVIQALLKPGHPLQRAARRVTGFLMILLPMLAVGLIVSSFFRTLHSASWNLAGISGMSLLATSGVVLLLSAGLPALLDFLLKPSARRSAERAFARVLERGLDQVDERLTRQLEAARDRSRAARTEGDGLLKRVAAMLIRPVRSDRAALAQVIAGRQAETPSIR